MGDPAKSSRDLPSRSPHKSKVVRSQQIAATSPTAPRPELDESSDSDDTSDPPPPVPRSHTPGHLASKSRDQRRKPSDLSIRQRSQSSPQAPHAAASASSIPSSRTPAPPAHTPKQAASQAGSNAADSAEDGKTPQKDPSKRPAAPRAMSAIAGRGIASAPRPTSRPSTTTTTTNSRYARDNYTPFPPLQDPKTAPDVPLAAASGMYWSRAPVSGQPHPSLRAHTTTLIGSNIYVFGGCDSKTCFRDLYVFDGDSFHWSKPHVVGDVPLPLRAMTCTAVGKKLVVFGGGDGPAYYNDVYVLDTVNFRWSKPRIVGDRVPSKRRAHTACLYKNGIYVFGGGDGVRALNDVWRLDVSDTSKMSWKLVCGPDKADSGGGGGGGGGRGGGGGGAKPMPMARGYHTANMVSNNLIIFGGSDGGECFSDVWVYDVDGGGGWKCASIPVAYRRLSHTATIVGSYLFVVGGHNGNEYSNEVLLLNLVTMTWDKKEVYGLPPSGRGYHGAVLYDSRLFVIGGFDGGEVFGDVWMLELAVHAYYSQISHFTIVV
ncbi:related to KEL2 - involved in cell fusion and morphogenesis [Cephalotrichum gorgonifer]|uniref:Related to KEL2 - involved in cell fusion and morphogenesis n=1 Tax=Cephalotrichum gorgonifer TaxID=2041049 RepID=A0AAE8MZM8_9PEZI|nr:related to KEL2 - involved in cell fusion and morphogenesis [Cephalotrichum gorgonifer]